MFVVLMGEFQHTLDSKGRLIIPAKLRDQLGDKLIVTRGLDGCLFGYPLGEWEKLEVKLNSLPLTKRDARAFVRFMYSAATECAFDHQGRINIPRVLCHYAQLTKRCTIIGVAKRLEIWDEARWSGYSQKTADDFDEIAEKLQIDF